MTDDARMDDTAPNPSSRGRSIAIRIAKWLAILVAVLALLVAGAVIAIDTRPGHALLVRQLAGIDTASGLNIRIGKIRGSLYGKAEITNVTVRDADGVFLTIPSLTLDWRPFAYIQNRIDIRELSAHQVFLARLPRLKPTPSDPNAPLLPDIDINLNRLAVDEFVIEKGVTGQKHVVTVRGALDIADARARAAFGAVALSGGGLAGGDRLRLRFDAVPKRNRLVVDMRLSAPTGGLVDSYAGLGKPIDLRIGGQGDWENWHGFARARLDSEALADLGIAAKNGTFGVVGRVRPALVLTGPAARLASPAINVNLTARLGERRVDTRINLQSSAMRVDAGGMIDLGQNRFGQFHAAAVLLTPGAIAENLRGRDVRLGLGIDGPFATPTVDYHLTAAAIGFGDMLLQGLDAAGHAVVDANHITVPVAASATRVTGLNAALGGLVHNLRVDGTIAYSNGQFLSDDLKLSSSRINATAIILVDPAKGRYTGALKGRINGYDVNGLGKVNLVTDAHLITVPSGGFGITGHVSATLAHATNSTVRNMLGGRAILNADVGYDPAGLVTIRNVHLRAPRFRVVRGQGSYRISDGRIALRAAAASADYGPLALVVSGTATRPVAHLRASRPGLGLSLADVDVYLRGTAQGYDVKANGGSAYGPFSADLLVRSGNGPLSVNVRDVRLAGVGVRGDISQSAAGPFTGMLAIGGNGFTGSARLSANGANQQADLLINAASARIPSKPPITIGGGTARATVVLYPQGPSVIADARLNNVRRDQFLLSNAQVRVRYANGSGQLALVASGRSGAVFNVAGQAALSPDHIRANVKGTINNTAIRLAAPADITRTGNGWQLAPTTVVLPRGQMIIGGTFGNATNVDARLEKVDLSLADAFVPGLGLGGEMNGTIRFNQTGTAFPAAQARIDIAHFTRSGVSTVSAPTDIAMLASLSDTGADASAVIRLGDTPVGRLKAHITPQAGNSWSERLAMGNLSGGIRYNGPSQVLWALTGISGQEVRGPAVIAADFGGRLNEPTLTGIVRADALRYENQAYGTVLNNIAVRGRFSQSRLDISSLTAKAGDGTVSASGYIGFDAASGFPMALDAKLDHAQLARSNALGAQVSGTLSVSNSKADGALIKGDLSIPEARYQIIRQGAAEVPELQGVRRKSQSAEEEEKPAPGFPQLWKLDLRVRADNRVYVSGMGLESEWQTDLRVRGTAAQPAILGTLQVVRGTYSFAGRRFDITSGQVQFEGGATFDPQINITAETSVEDITATINITGSALNPQVSFTSNPTLPQDEVLSRLLFGTSVTSLSPTQAIQLAAALNSLRGSGGGLNPLGKLRSATGIDRLRVLGEDKTTGRGTALAAGQYISNDIYLEVITDARGFTATQIQVALSKSLSILSETSSFGGSSVNLRYKKDY